MKSGSLIAAALLCGGSILPAIAQTTTVTVTVTEVRNALGNILGNLCDDTNTQFPRACLANGALAKSEQGETVLVFQGIEPGRYALQAFHDEDGNMIPDIPPEGYAFGNDATWLPSFEDASFIVTGETRVSVRMQYAPSFGAAPATQPRVEAAASDAGRLYDGGEARKEEGR